MSDKDNRRAARTAIVSTSVPPAATGQATVLKRLFENHSPETCLFLTDDLGTDHARVGELSFASYAALPVPNLKDASPTATVAVKLSASISHLQAVFARARQTVKHLEKFNPDVVIACSGSRVDLPATWLACTWLRLPFVTYLFDDPVHQWGGGRLSRLASLFESLWSTTVAAVIVPNDLLLGDLKLRRPALRCLTTVIRNPIENGSAGLQAIVEPKNSEQVLPKKIVYSGSIYSAQADALKNLIDAIEIADGLYELHIYTPQPEAVIEGLQLRSRFLKFHGYVGGSEIYMHQQSADILFLPLAFKSNIQPCLRTAAPGKTGEYLASGRPVLVHAPDYSFISQYFKLHECGIVVDEPSSTRLLEALDKLTKDSAFCARIVESARSCASEFSAEAGQEKMNQLIQAIAFGKNRPQPARVRPALKSNIS